MATLTGRVQKLEQAAGGVDGDELTIILPGPDGKDVERRLKKGGGISPEIRAYLGRLNGEMDDAGAA